MLCIGVRLRAIVCIALVCLTFDAAALMADDTYVASVDEAWMNGNKNYANARYQAAFQDFYWVAIRDHPQAQGMVGIMYLLGPETFGSQVRHNRVEADFWLEEARRNGLDVAEFLSCAISRKVSELPLAIAQRALACGAIKKEKREKPGVEPVRTERTRRILDLR